MSAAPNSEPRIVPQSSDDDHGEVEDAGLEREALPRDDVAVVRGEGAGEPHEERRGREGQELGPEHVHADDARGDVLVADGDEGAADAGAEEVRGEERRGTRQRDAEPIEAEVRVQPLPEQPRGRDDDRFDPSGECGPMRDDPFDDLLGGERGDRQVEPLEPQRGEAEEYAHRRGREAGGHDAHAPGQAQPQREERGGVRPDGHEGALAQRDLPGVADEDVQPQRADRGDRDLVREVEPVGRREEREDEERRREQAEPDALRRHAPEPHVRSIVRVKDAALQAKTLLSPCPRYTRSMISFPKSPYGRTMRTMINTMYGTMRLSPWPM